MREKITHAAGSIGVDRIRCRLSFELPGCLQPGFFTS
jgi:hypothetical protein